MNNLLNRSIVQNGRKNVNEENLNTQELRAQISIPFYVEGSGGYEEEKNRAI